MPKQNVKKTTAAQSDPVIWGVTGAYVVGILMAGLISIMVSPVSFRSDLEYNSTQAAFSEESPSEFHVDMADNSDVAKSNPVVMDTANVLKNGSFELPIIRSQSKLLTELSGWAITWANPGNPKLMSLTKQPGVELLAGYQAWQAAEGAQFARLDTADLGARSARSQSLVALTQKIQAANGVYHLSLDFAAQPKTSAKDNQLEVRWNGKVLATLSADGSKDTKPQWKNYGYTVNVAGQDTLEIVAKGTENNQGVLVDNFSLTKVTR